MPKFRTIDQIRTSKMDGRTRTSIIFDDQTMGSLKEIVHLYRTSAGEVIRELINNFVCELNERRKNMKTIEGCKEQIVNNLRHMGFYLQLAEENLDSKIDSIIGDAYDSFVKERKFIVDLKKIAKEILALIEINPEDCEDKVGEVFARFCDFEQEGIDNQETMNLWNDIGNSSQKEAIKCFDAAVDYHEAWLNLIHGEK